MKKIWQIECMASNLRCVICGGWGGEFGRGENGRAICRDCWGKGSR